MDFILTIISILASAFGGAFAAFKLQEYRDEKKEIKKRSSYIRETMFSLIQQEAILRGLKNKIEPLEKDPLRFLKIRPLSTTIFNDTKIEIKNISFLLDSNDPGLLIEISKCQDEFAGTLNMTQLRSLRHHEKLSPILEKLKINTEIDIDKIFKSISDLNSKLGAFLTGALKNETDQMYDSVYEALDLIDATLERLKKYAIKEFPDEKLSRIFE